MTYRKTKIVATIGPASSDLSTLKLMIKSGMNVARINCSHGTHEEYKKQIETIRAAAASTKSPVAILLDLGGPKIRIGDFAAKKINLKKGAPFTLTTKKVDGDEHCVSLNYKKLPKEVKPGMRILLEDGKKVLEVTSVHGEDIHTKVIVGGEIHSRRGVNVPEANLSIASVTPKDLIDLDFGVSMGVDFIALSFVKDANDVLKVREALMKKRSAAGVIAKIETRSAVKHIDAIIEAARGIMVARGDLAVEIPKEEVPLVQKTIIRKCNAAGKAVITATQMLDSMATHPSPTRAEVNDVANAIFDGTDAVMLSGETAMGEHPALAIETMAHIALVTEASELYHEEKILRKNPSRGIVDSVSSSVARIAETVNASTIVALTESGFTARMVSRHKSNAPILALTPHESTYRQLALSYGCYPIITKPVTNLNDALKIAKTALLKSGFAKSKDIFVLAVGVPFGIRGGTNALMVQTV